SEKQPDRNFGLTRLKELLGEKEETAAFVVAGLLPQAGLSVAAAKPKTGKSTLARCAAKAVALGEPFLGRNPIRGHLIYLALEEKRAEVRRHFKDMGCTGQEQIHVLTSSAPSILELRAAVEKIKPALVIIDPLFRFVRIGDINSYGKMLEATDPL